MTGYDNGAVLERATRAELKDAGYFVIRAAGSKTPVDLAAFKRGEVLFVQCKADGYMRPDELRELWETAVLHAGAKPLIAWWHKPGRAARTVAFRSVYRDLNGRTVRGPEWTPDWAVEAADA